MRPSARPSVSSTASVVDPSTRRSSVRSGPRWSRYGRRARTSPSRDGGTSSEGCVAMSLMLLAPFGGHDARDGVRPRVDRVTRDDAAAELDADLGAETRRCRCERDQDLGQALRVTRTEAELEAKLAEQHVERRVAREHRDAGRSRLEHDLVERLAAAGLGRTEEGVDATQQLGQVVARQGGLDPNALLELGRAGDGAPQLLPVRPPVPRQLRPADLELGIDPAL